MCTDPHCFLNRVILADRDPAYKQLEQQQQAAIQAGDQAKANALRDQLREREVKAFHAQRAKEQAWAGTLGQMAAIGGVGCLTRGAGVPAYLLSRAAMSATSMALDPSLRRQWAVGDWPGALAASQAHLPLWGPLHSGFNAVGHRDYVQAALQAGAFALDVAGLRYAGRNSVGTKGVNAIKVGNYTFTNTAAKHLPKRPYMNSPGTIINIMKSGKGVPDATFKGGINYKVPGTFGGSKGVWELGINPETNTIYHFVFKSAKK